MAGKSNDMKIGGLAALVAAWWLAIAAMVVASMPGPVASAPKAPFVVEPGRIAHIEQPGLPDWPMPVERAAFDELRRAYREADEHAIERATQRDGVDHRPARRARAGGGGRRRCRPG